MQTHNCETEPKTTNQVTSKSCAKYIYATSWLFLLSSIYALYRRHYDISAVTFVLFASSIFYWSHPLYDWRRNLDIVIAILAWLYLVYKSFTSKRRNTFLIFPILIILVYFYEWVEYVNPHHSTLLHCCVHIFSNCAAILYCI